MHRLTNVVTLVMGNPGRAPCLQLQWKVHFSNVMLIVAFICLFYYNVNVDAHWLEFWPVFPFLIGALPMQAVSLTALRDDEAKLEADRQKFEEHCC
eukprot:5944978-Amphidinium_carterae.1